MTESTESSAPSVQSSRFNATDADVTFRSSDGVLFSIHLMNLKANTDGFIPPANATFDEIVELTESSATLDMLFKFIYPARHPDLESIEFTVLDRLAEAAEKYQVYAAMNICKIRMKGTLPSHASQVMLYAMKHGYPDIMDLAAPILIARSLKDSSSNMPVQYLLPWIMYHDAWLSVLRKAMSFYFAKHTPLLSMFQFGAEPTSLAEKNGTAIGVACKTGPCKSGIEQRVVNVMATLGGNVGALRNLDSVFGSPSELLFLGCISCQSRFGEWRKATEADISRIPKFSTFL
ncbi:hypothetical protein D9615_006298 [Tricholomella constricta]|uniref:BTB domain-containing protein n=1 Tax=Tricholomella constricta TaxID=117010 RepID=A0A8H5HB29_9AGAR|nr:hypothetical protein D9615_006298 [Tricholomella constricta]